MHVRMICPAPPRSLYGNRVSALRWAAMLRKLGHRVTIAQRWEGEACDLMLALHASRSAEAALAFRERHPEKPLVVALTGTDLYRDLPRDPKAQRVIEIADRLVALQPLAARELPPRLRRKMRVIYQSVPRVGRRARRAGPFFDVCVVGHLREVKDPFLAARASRLLPASSRIRVRQAGVAIEDGMAEAARAEEARNPRYRWLGGIPRWKARRLMAESRLMVLSSRLEGGANTISEALVEHTPVLASKIPGSVGLLGRRYPGYFPVGDAAALARLLARAEADAAFHAKLKGWCSRLAPMFRPDRELAAWRKLLQDLR